MGRRKKHKKQRSVSTETLEHKARNHLSNGRFKEAREAFKQLRGQDYSRYVAELIQCCEGQVAPLLDADAAADVDAALAHLRPFYPGLDMEDLRRRLRLGRGDYAGVLASYLKSIAASADEPTPDTVADALVLSFSAFPELETHRPALAAECRAVQEALAAVSAGDYAAAAAHVRAIGRNSVFANWRMFVKGLTAFYAGEDEKALDAFGRLPAGTGPAAAAQPFRLLIDEGFQWPESNKEQDALIAQACEIADLPKQLAEALPRADYLWRVGRLRDSCRLMRDSAKEFPTDAPTALGRLSEFYLNAALNLPPDQAGEYVRHVLRPLHEGRCRSWVEAAMLWRIKCLAYEDALEDQGLWDCWTEFLEAYADAYEPNERLESLVFLHLGAEFSVLVDAPYGFRVPYSRRRARDCLRNAKMATAAFRLSVERNPEDRDAHCRLADVLSATGEKSKLNRLLDEMIRKFPDDKETLLRTGQACILRKSQVKGVKYLEAAVHLDPLDRRARELLSIGYLHLANRYFSERRIEKGREIYQKAVENAYPDARNFNLGRAFICVRWAAREFFFGELQAGNALLEQALACGVSEFPLLLFAEVICESVGVSTSAMEPLVARVKEAFAGPADAATAADLMEVVGYTHSMVSADYLKSQVWRVSRYASAAAAGPCSREVAERIIRCAMEGDFHKKLVTLYLKKMLAADKDDPLFIYLEVRAAMEEDYGMPKRGHLKRLLHAREMAERRGETVLIPVLNKEISEIESYHEFEHYMEGVIEDEGDLGDGEDWEDEWDEDVDAGLDVGLPERMAEQIRELGRRLIEQQRKRAKEEEDDESRRPHTAGGKAGDKGKRGSVHPNQLNLFDDLDEEAEEDEE